MLWLDYYWHKVLRRPYTLSCPIDKGRGQPVVFLHGIASNGEKWRHAADMLDESKYRVIALDLLGFGDSPRPDWLEYSVEDHTKAVLASLRRLHIRKPVILVGHSMGGLVAAHLAQKYPSKVKQLILYQMPLYGDVPKVKAFRQHAYMSVFRYLADNPKMTLWYARVLGRTASKMAGFVLDEHSWQPFEMSLRNTIMQQRSLNNLRRLTMPTDVVYGKYDVFVMSKALRHYFRPSKHIKFYEIDDIHRVSARSNQLLFDLITQDPRHDRVLTTKHARLIDMRKHLTVEIVSESEQQTYTKSSYKWWLLVSVVTLLASGLLASNGVGEAEATVFRALNAGESLVYIEAVARFVSNMVWMAAGIVALALLFPKSRLLAFRIAVLAVATNVLVYLVEHVVARGRPGELLANDTVQRAVQDGFGFPSSHTATIAIIMLVLWPRLSPILRFASLLTVLLVGWSRIFLGVHFPLDIVGGVACAGVVYCAFNLIPRKYLRHVHLK